MIPRRQLLFSLPLLLALVAGCNPSGPSRGFLRGRFLYHGEEVPAGNLAVHSASGVFPTAFDRGHFALDVPADEGLIITLETESLKVGAVASAKYGDDRAGGGMAADDYLRQMKERGAPVKEATGATRPYLAIPAKYADKATSPLTLIVPRGVTDKTFTLED
jgi:hypothetical protein